MKTLAQRIARVTIVTDEADDGGQCGAVLVSLFDETGKYVFPEDVKGGEDLLGHYGCKGVKEAAEIARRLFPSAEVVVDE